jgi:carboxyl-terminal processing protease
VTLAALESSQITSVEIPQAVLEKWTPANIATQKDTQYIQALAVLMQRISRLK